MTAAAFFSTLLEHVAQKWIPVLRNDMRQNKEIARDFGVIKTHRAPGDIPGHGRGFLLISSA
jgi:hypothetical protein